jgi:lipoprotein-anchoring transpeptidase ErfK/SrfK
MRRIPKSACVVIGLAASAVLLPIVPAANAQAPLLDPGWTLAYPGGQPNSGGLIAHVFSEGPAPYPAGAYQPPPAYYQRAPQQQGYQPAPRYYVVVPAQQLRPYQPPAPQYYAVAPAAQPRIDQPPPAQYYAAAPAPPPAAGYQPAPVYYQATQNAPPYVEPPPGARLYAAVGFAPSAIGDMAHPRVDPKYDRQVVDYPTDQPPGTVIIDTPHYFLYLVMADGKALRYGIGVGRPGFTWAGTKEVSAKREWPDWRPPDDMLHRRPDLPRYMAGGPENPLGARAIYLGSTLYRIHGSNEPLTIGTQVSSGCIRLRNEDVIDLYGRVKVGTKVVVI